MIDPISTKIKLFQPILNIPNTVDSIRYNEKFKIDDLDPQIGQIYQIYVPTIYLKFEHQPISDQNVFGSTFYAPSSDIAAIVFHSGCLFIHPKLKAYKPVRFSTVQNFFESSIVSEADYAKIAVIIDLPTDLQIQGVNVRFYIDQSPHFFISTTHNNYKSQEIPHEEPFSLRIIDFNIITMYDNPPNLVSPENYRRQIATVPCYQITFTGEIGIQYTQQIFLQIFSRFNLLRDIFKYFFFLFDVGNDRFEISQIDESSFQVLKVIQQVSPELITVPNVEEDAAVVLDNVDMKEFGAKKSSLLIKNMEFKPMKSLLLIPRDVQ